MYIEVVIAFRNEWSRQEDIKLMSLHLEFHKEWAKIARAFPGRTQHQIKNRFFSVLAKRSQVKREIIRQIVSKNQQFLLVYETLNCLKEKTES